MEILCVSTVHRFAEIYDYRAENMKVQLREQGFKFSMFSIVTIFQIIGCWNSRYKNLSNHTERNLNNLTELAALTWIKQIKKKMQIVIEYVEENS